MMVMVMMMTDDNHEDDDDANNRLLIRGYRNCKCQKTEMLLVKESCPCPRYKGTEGEKRHSSTHS